MALPKIGGLCLQSPAPLLSLPATRGAALAARTHACRLNSAFNGKYRFLVEISLRKLFFYEPVRRSICSSGSNFSFRVGGGGEKKKKASPALAAFHPSPRCSPPTATSLGPFSERPGSRAVRGARSPFKYQPGGKKSLQGWCVALFSISPCTLGLGDLAPSQVGGTRTGGAGGSFGVLLSAFLPCC